jgi:hypothetical protein
VEPDNVYVMPPNSILTISDGTLRLRGENPDFRERKPIDIFLGALAADQLDCAVGPLNGGFGIKTARVGDNLVSHLRSGDGEIDESTGDGAIRHAGIARARTVACLSQRQSAPFLHRLDAERAVPVSSRKDHGDRALALIRGQCAKENVYRLALADGRVLVTQPKRAVGYGENRIGRHHVDVRLPADGPAQVIEVNATPDVARSEDFAASARAAGIPYPRLLERILGLALARAGA